MHVDAAYQPRSGPARAEPTRSRQFEPYGLHGFRATEHINGKPGPSRIPLRPRGGEDKFEITAETVKGQQSEEENKAPVSNFYVLAFLFHLISCLTSETKMRQGRPWARETPRLPRPDQG